MIKSPKLPKIAKFSQIFDIADLNACKSMIYVNGQNGDLLITNIYKKKISC